MTGAMELPSNISRVVFSFWALTWHLMTLAKGLRIGVRDGSVPLMLICALNRASVRPWRYWRLPPSTTWSASMQTGPCLSITLCKALSSCWRDWNWMPWSCWIRLQSVITWESYRPINVCRFLQRPLVDTTWWTQTSSLGLVSTGHVCFQRKWYMWLRGFLRPATVTQSIFPVGERLQCPLRPHALSGTFQSVVWALCCVLRLSMKLGSRRGRHFNCSWLRL